MEQNLSVFIVLIALIIGAPIAYAAVKVYRKFMWGYRLKMYRKTHDRIWLR